MFARSPVLRTASFKLNPQMGCGVTYGTLERSDANLPGLQSSTQHAPVYYGLKTNFRNVVCGLFHVCFVSTKPVHCFIEIKRPCHNPERQRALLIKDEGVNSQKLYFLIFRTYK